MPKRYTKTLLLLLLAMVLVSACDDGQPTQVYQPGSTDSSPVPTVRIIGQDPAGAANSGAPTPSCKSTPASGIIVGDGGCAKIDLPPGTSTPPLTQNGISVQGIRLEPGNTSIVAAPLRVLVKLHGSDGNLVVSASLRALDANGNVAIYGDSPGEPVSMFPSMEMGDWWEATTSAPTQPGVYYFAVDSQDAQRQKSSFVLRDAAIKVDTDPNPLVGGYLVSRNSNIWQMSPDAQRERQLSFYPEFRAVAKDARWSPDGKQIAYAYAPPPKTDADDPQSELWLMNADGSGKHQVLAPQKDENFESPSWSPDGKYLYFDTMRFTYDKDGNFLGQSWQLERLQIDGGKREVLLPNAQEPSISSDGKVLSYVEVLPDDGSTAGMAAAIPTLPGGAVATPLPGGSERLMLANSDSTAAKQVVGSSEFVAFYAPKLSPDDKRIVFAAIGGSANTQPICASPLATPTPQALRSVNGLAAPLYHGLPWDIWMVNVDGSGLTRLTQLNEDTPDVIWRDDSSHLTFIGITGLYNVDLSNGCTLTPLQTYNGGASHSQLSWFAAK